LWTARLGITASLLSCRSTRRSKRKGFGCECSGAKSGCWALLVGQGARKLKSHCERYSPYPFVPTRRTDASKDSLDRTVGVV
jgi:hypothetical protein